MSNYFIDIGNTRIKHTAEQVPFQVQLTKHTHLPPLFTAITRARPKYLLVCSGRSATAQQTHTAITDFAKAHSLSLDTITTRPEMLAVNYQDPQQFGSDRFLHLLAGRERCQSAFCVVSAGTAITLDFYLDRHIGGMILPGLGSAKSLLADKTGLTAIEMPASLLGDDTATTVGAGIYVGYQNLIHRSIERVSTAYHTQFTTLFTGGDAGNLQQPTDSVNNTRNQYAQGHIINQLLFEGMLCYQKLK